MYLYHYNTESLVLSGLVLSLHEHSSSLDTVLHVILNTVIICTIDKLYATPSYICIIVTWIFCTQLCHVHTPYIYSPVYMH